MKKFDKNYTNFIQMYLIINNKSITGPIDCCGIKFIKCHINCIFYKDKCTLWRQHASVTKFLDEHLSTYTNADKLTYLIQGEFNGTNT